MKIWIKKDKNMQEYYYNEQNLYSNTILDFDKKYNVGFQEKVYYDKDRNREIDIAIWYPTHNKMAHYCYRNIFTCYIAVNSVIINKKFPLIIFSHGSGGHKFNQSYLAEFMTTKGFICIAIEHDGDSALNNSLSKSHENLLHRPLDVKFILNKIFNEQLINYIDVNSIGIAGHSFGGYTSLALLGGTIKIINKNFKDDRIKSAFLMAPALSKLFDKKYLNNLTVPICLVVSNNDEFLYKDNINFKKNLKNIVTYINFIGAGHYIYLMLCPKNNKFLVDEIACLDIGINRELAHPILKKHILEFCRNHLIKR